MLDTTMDECPGSKVASRRPTFWFAAKFDAQFLFGVRSSFNLPPMDSSLAGGFRGEGRSNRAYGAIGGARGGIVLNVGIDTCRSLISVAEDRAVIASVSPNDTAAEPNVWRKVCGVTPGRPAIFTIFGQIRFVP